MPQNKCVVSFADGAGDYRKKLLRLQESMRRHTDADLLMFTDYKQINSEPHQVIPYKFKAMAINEAINKGYELILWCDSPIVAVKPLDYLFDHINRKGYVFFDNIGHPLGRWTNDKCLEYFKVSREQAMDIKMIMACCMGFKVNNLTAGRFLADYIALADKLYPGTWADHRHDQTVASFLIHELQMKILKGQETFFAYESHRNVLPISESVCLLSR
jgi:hypothetical protein